LKYQSVNSLIVKKQI